MSMNDNHECIDFEEFLRVDIRSGTVIEAKVNAKARVPAYILKIDFGDIGIKTSSAQLTKNYSLEDLPGLQVIAVVNFPVKRIAGVKSEVLVLGTDAGENDVVLLGPRAKVGNGLRVC